MEGGTGSASEGVVLRAPLVEKSGRVKDSPGMSMGHVVNVEEMGLCKISHFPDDERLKYG